MSDNLRKETLTNASALNIAEHAVREGMRTIMGDGLEKVKMGITTVREVLGGTDKEEEKK